MILYHATAKKNLSSILKNGMKSHSYWTSRHDILDYYVETIEDEDETPVILTVNLSELQEENICPDFPGLEEPITTVLEMSEEEVWDEWQNTETHWKDCLNLIGSICYRNDIPASKLSVDSE